MNAISKSFWNNLVSPRVAFGYFAKTSDKIKSFGKLPIGWNFGEGVPANAHIVQKALSYEYIFLSIGSYETDAFPGIDGQIMVCAYRGRHCVEITIEADDLFTVTYQLDTKDVSYLPDVSELKALESLARVLAEIERSECDSFESSIFDITTLGNKNLTTWPSLQAETRVLQFSTPSASSNVHQSVNIFSDHMTRSVVHPRSFGPSTTP